MPSRTSLDRGVFQTFTESDPMANVDIEKLQSLAVQGLVPMFDAARRLFCNRLVRTEQGLVREGLSPRYTIMTLLGLRELERAGGNSPFNTRGLYEFFVRDTNWIQCAGDLGLLVWLIAEFNPAELEDFWTRLELPTALERFADARHRRTTELGWFLAGLSHAALASPKLASDLKDLAVDAYCRIKDNQGEHGFFGHMAKSKSVAGLLRGRIGSFADQVYPIYALSKFAIAFNVVEAKRSALSCASAICNAQGTLGQWWWLYDSQTGRVSSRYPVYSVHQHGMAPMCLFAVEEATQESFRGQIFKGLRWIYGSNELGVDMRDLPENLVWRCILPQDSKRKYLDVAQSLIRSPKGEYPATPFKILHEDRPYELGWLLYAFARFGNLAI